jgi:hypothetical protein
MAISRGKLKAVGNTKLAELIREAKGNLSAVGKAVGANRVTVALYVKKHPELQKVCDEARESVLDMAEDKLFELASAGNLGAICFILKCIGKHRGWIERMHVTHAVTSLELTEEIIECRVPAPKAIEAEAVESTPPEPPSNDGLT